MIYHIHQDIFQATVGSFTDDTRLRQAIRDTQDINALQLQLNHMNNWADSKNMSFNGEKFEVIWFRKSENQPKYKDPSGKEIKYKKCMKDLGVYVTEDPKFDAYIKNITAAGHRMAAWVLRTLKTRGLSPLMMLLKTLIVTQVEYCCSLWASTDTHNIALLESVRWQFTSRISAFQTYGMTLNMPVCTVNHENGLKRLKIYSWERRE